MDRDATTLLKEALRLSAPDRVALAEALIASLDEDVYDSGVGYMEERNRASDLRA